MPAALPQFGDNVGQRKLQTADHLCVEDGTDNKHPR
jgi:hypothetical protein